jgi:hypothetical protein
VFASQAVVVWPFDITLSRGCAADGRLVELEAQMVTAGVSMWLL